MYAEPMLLLVLGMGGILYLIPYWEIWCRGVTASQAQIDVRVVPRHTLESLREPLYFLIAYKQDQATGKRLQIEVFPWHSENAYRRREDAEAAVALAGVKINGYQPIAIVQSVFGKRQFVVASLNLESKRQIFVWSLISACLCMSAVLLGCVA